ncbi:PREDICTED: U-box domain-containing protein 52-like [Ipomoea nil]|uniref:U-box domain-containing protein 52-like n=1 Tax=Ipomoea nil TaxID=35883 RepID=UPI00090123A0|nr:PREDICTED: U-box domain-containing protein 52-like [Ipomoea nil]
MWLQSSKPAGAGQKTPAPATRGLVALAVDKDKGSQSALKWTTENLVSRGQTLVLIHVLHKSFHGSANAPPDRKQQIEKHTKELFGVFHVFCTRKDIHPMDVILEDTDVSKALMQYVSGSGIENLVLGASKHGFLKRLKVMDIPTCVSKGAPDFCTVYVISKAKISSVRNASRPAPFMSPLYNQINKKNDEQQPDNNNNTNTNNNANNGPPTAAVVPKAVNSTSPAPTRHKHTPTLKDKLPTFGERNNRPSFMCNNDMEIPMRSPFDKAAGRGIQGKPFSDISDSDMDISFVSSGRPSTDASSMFNEGMDTGRTSRVSTCSSESNGFGSKANDSNSVTDFSTASLESEEGDAEMKRLKQDLQKMMDLYSTACKEALTAKQKATELQLWRIEEEKRLEETSDQEDVSKVSSEGGMRSGCSEPNASSTEEQDNGRCDFRYRKYTIEEIEEATERFAVSRKIGEGGYGPVFKCILDHTNVAVKVLRPDATQGMSQFHKEVQVLSCLRHPNMVLLLGACPEYGCLVYDYMGNGSLEERILKPGDKPALSWQVRFRIAAEVGTGLLFLHQTKPEPVVHRDLKPGNILLDDCFAAKISDVGLARLVPPTMADDVTQLRMTSAAGTFCYIDPEYQQTGMLGVKSDVYSFGIVLLQLITAKPAMGIAHHAADAFDKGTFLDMLDPVVTNWPVEEVLAMGKLALRCAQLRRKDRPDLGKEVMPELLRFKELADQSINKHMMVIAQAS